MSDFEPETKNWSDSYRGYDAKFPVMDLDQRLRRVEEQLLLVSPDPAQLAKYPALAEAYANYKLIEKLTVG
jgi:hypothetical protein